MCNLEPTLAEVPIQKTSVIGKEEVDDLRYVARDLLEWVSAMIENQGYSDFWQCLGNEDEIREVVKFEMQEIKEQLPKDDEQLARTLDALHARLASKSGRTPSDTRNIFDACIERFLTDCASQPGPEEEWEYGEPPSLKWDIRFSEEAFRRMASDLGKVLELRFADERTEVRVNCTNLRFSSSFEIQANLRYDSDSNQFILTCSRSEALTNLRKQARIIDYALTNVLALVYGVEFRLGDVVALLPLSRGGNELILRTRLTQNPLEPDTRLTPTPLMELWEPVLLASQSKDRQQSILLSKLKSVGDSPEDRLVDLMTCFEILLSDGDEIRHKLAVRGAALLRFLGETKTFDVLLQAYKNRNDIVHGNVKSTKLNPATLLESNSKLTAWLRILTLTRILTAKKKRRFFEYADLLVKRSIDPRLMTKADLESLNELAQAASKIKGIRFGA